MLALQAARRITAGAAPVGSSDKGARAGVSRESGVCGRDHSGCRCAGECAGGGRARAAAGEAALASGAGPLGVRCCCMFV